MKRYYYSDRLTTEGETLGPVNVEELKELYFEKKITEDCLVCLEGTEDQLKIDELISRYNKSGDNKKLEALWNTTKLIFMLLLFGSWLLLIYVVIMAILIIFGFFKN